MVDRKEVLAIIPARGGSKGIPHKNIRLFCGYPLIAYSIAAARQSQLVTRVIVSTDDSEIAETAKKFGAEVPFMRPDEFAQDQTLDLPVFEHALAWLAEHEDYHPDVVVQLRPTSPIRPTGLVDEAVKMLLKHPEADSVRGVVPAGQNPHKMWRIDDHNGNMLPLLQVEGIAEPYNAPRQILPPVYWQTGHIDAIRPSAILEKHSMSGDIILPVLIDPRFTVDIDNLFDWKRYEYLVVNGNLDMVYPGQRRRPLPDEVELIVFDFDGVMTDNRVWVGENGNEQVAASRGDGYGLKLLRKHTSIKCLVLSTEKNPVVTARCKKLDLPVISGAADKPPLLMQYLKDNHIDPQKVVYLGNDVNDVPCFPLVGCAVVVADAELAALQQADMVLNHCGGHGAVRELCDIFLQRNEERSSNA